MLSLVRADMKPSKQHIVLPGQGKSYDWSKDHVFVKAAHDLSDGRLTLVEDTLKPGFSSPGTTTRR